MVATNLEVVVDGDGHIVEDLEAIAKHFPPEFLGDEAQGRSSLGKIFPPGDHLHAAQPLKVLPGSFTKPNADEWLDFANEVGIESAVLYPSNGLGYGHVVSRDWAIALCQAYNNWLYETYVQKSSRFKGVALIPMQDPAAAVVELRRAIEDLGFVGAMLPSTGLPLPLGDKAYWPVYEEADRLGCAMSVHGGAHDRLGLDHMNVYAAVNALGHPFGISIAFSSILLNGLFEKYPNAKFGFLEGGIGWMLMCVERLERAYDTHIPLDPRDELISLREGETLVDYIRRQVAEGRLFVGCEGDEPLLSVAIQQLGNGFPVFSSDFPHEVTSAMCQHEIQEVLGNAALTDEDKQAIMSTNAQRFYGLVPVRA